METIDQVPNENQLSKVDNKAGKERARLHVFILIGLIAISALTYSRVQRFNPPLVSEDEIRSKVPMDAGNWHAIDKDRDMGKDAYEMLRPQGISWRIYRNDAGDQVDFVLMAATHSGAFHDPTLCFSNQGQKILVDKERELQIDSLNRTIKVHMLRVRDSNNQYLTAFYWWRNSSGQDTASHLRIQFESWTGKILGLRGSSAFFYRVIVKESGNPEADYQILKGFVSDMYGALKTTYPEAVGLKK